MSVIKREIPGGVVRSPNGRSHDANGRALSSKFYDVGSEPDQMRQATKILSPSSIDGTPRSSGEFYSMSSHSTETLASEYVPQENSRQIHTSATTRGVFKSEPAQVSKPETLMMGYGQIIGYFILDESLVNRMPFEEVKRKGIIGGQGGGGLVQNKSSKRENGLLGSISWGNFGGSLGSFLGGSELSSVKETDDGASARSIPILSTPQSVLFVDLRLGPGESKSYRYSHPLPKGLPPSYRGRAIRTVYNLVVGTQRASKITQQHQVQRANIAFRVLPSVDSRLLTLSVLISL